MMGSIGKLEALGKVIASGSNANEGIYHILQSLRSCSHKELSTAANLLGT